MMISSDMKQPDTARFGGDGGTGAEELAASRSHSVDPSMLDNRNDVISN